MGRAVCGAGRGEADPLEDDKHKGGKHIHAFGFAQGQG